MSQPVLLDTSALLTLIRGGPVAQRIDEHLGLSRRHQRPFVSIVTHGEIRVLAALRRWGPRKLQALRETLTQTVTVNISPPEVLEAYVRLDLHSEPVTLSEFQALMPLGGRCRGRVRACNSKELHTLTAAS